MKRSMFSRLMTVFLAVILICSAVLMGFFYLSMRRFVANTRINDLKEQANEMAYLASLLENDRVLLDIGQTTTTERYIKWKADNIYEQFSAYCVVIDRSGRMRAYINKKLLSDEELLATFDTNLLSNTLSAVLSGHEVASQTDTSKGPMFTVAVPWVRDGSVLGAVVIQTAAQTIRAAYTTLIWPTIGATAIAFWVAAGLSLLFTRQITHPLTQMELAAQRMARGDFTARAPETGSRETLALAKSFNRMVAQLAELETSRKEFIANVSHELRSPITSIQGYMQSMLDGTIGQEEQPHYMQVVVDETRRLSKLINGLLNLSRMEREDVSLARTDFDLNELARRVLITKMPQIDEKNIDISADFAVDPCTVHADADQIEQVLINLVDNALKFTAKGGHLRLSSRIEGKTVFLTVADDGCGVPPEDQTHIFDRFYKADKAHTVGKGTGLGLAICKCIMEKHGQNIRLLPTEKGAAFEISLELGTQKLTGGDNGTQGAGQAELDA